MVDKVDEEKAAELHKKHEALTEKIYNTPGMMPNRYVYFITTDCNLNCDFCCLQRERYKPEEKMTTQDWMNLSDQLPDYARVGLGGAEPLMFPGFKEVFSYVAEKHDCNIITNGLLLNEEIIDYMLSFEHFKVLAISVDNVGNTLRKIKPEKWKKVEDMIHYFTEQRDEINPECVLDLKTMVLDENAEQLFDIRKYCVENLGCDTQVFQFLKGSPIQHSDHMYSLDDVMKKSKAPRHKKFNIIREQLEKIRQYNLETGTTAFLHPKMGSLMSNDDKALKALDYIENPFHNRKDYEFCKYPWSSVHINVEGSLYPCLAVPAGNVKKQSLKEIINGEKMNRFRELVKKQGTVQACNHCGWLKPL